MWPSIQTFFILSVLSFFLSRFALTQNPTATTTTNLHTLFRTDSYNKPTKWTQKRESGGHKNWGDTHDVTRIESRWHISIQFLPFPPAQNGMTSHKSSLPGLPPPFWCTEPQTIGLCGHSQCRNIFFKWESSLIVSHADRSTGWSVVNSNRWRGKTIEKDHFKTKPNANKKTNRQTEKLEFDAKRRANPSECKVCRFLEVDGSAGRVPTPTKGRNQVECCHGSGWQRDGITGQCRFPSRQGKDGPAAHPPFAADGHDGCPRWRMKDEQEEEEEKNKGRHARWMDGWMGGPSVRVVDFSLSCLYSAPSSRNLPECALYYTTSFPTNEWRPLFLFHSPRLLLLQNSGGHAAIIDCLPLQTTPLPPFLVRSLNREGQQIIIIKKKTKFFFLLSRRTLRRKKKKIPEGWKSLCAFDDRPKKKVFQFRKRNWCGSPFFLILAGCHPTKAHRHTVTTTTTTAVMMMMATSPSQSKLLELAPAATPGK